MSQSISIVEDELRPRSISLYEGWVLSASVMRGQILSESKD
jgi:hypothetical protein